MLKDLGKVCGFAGDSGGARTNLERSLEIHVRCLGESHVRTMNVKRLSRYDA